MRNLRNYIKFFFQGILPSIKYYSNQLIKWLKPFSLSIIEYFSHIINGIKSQITLVKLLFVLLVIFLVGLFILLSSSQSNFEGKLLVKQFSFTNYGYDQLFLRRIQNIREIFIEGKISGKNKNNNLILSGKFSDFTDTKNSPINQSRRLHIKLHNPSGKLIISSATLAENSGVTIQSLRLKQDTKIKDLYYNFYKNSLDFSLEPDSSFSELQLNLGAEPVKVTLTGEYELTNESQQTIVKSSKGKYRDINFSFKPNSSNLEFILASNTNLVIYLPEIKKNELQKWFNRQLEVRDVIFESQDQVGKDVRDQLPISYILQGKIRMSNQNLDLDEEQFLEIEKPGIRQLSNLKILAPQISHNSNLSVDDRVSNGLLELTGLNVGISGKSKSIKVGISKEFPVASIRGNYLTQSLSQDFITAAISFSTAMIIAIVTGLINIWRSPNT